MSYTGNQPQFEGVNVEGQDTKVILQPTVESSGTGFLYIESSSTGAYAGNICMFKFLDKQPGNPYFIIENQDGAGNMSSRALFGMRGHDGMFQHESGYTFRIEQWGGGLGSLTADSLNTNTLTASGAISGSNLSGTNTGDQDLSSYQTIAGLKDYPTYTSLADAITGGLVSGDLFWLEVLLGIETVKLLTKV